VESGSATCGLAWMMDSRGMHAYDAIVMGIPACHEEIPFGGRDIKYGPDKTEYYQRKRGSLVLKL